MGKLEWVTNAPENVTEEYLNMINETKRNYQNWRSKLIIGEPQKTEKYTSKELVESGFIGLYRQVNNESED